MTRAAGRPCRGVPPIAVSAARGVPSRAGWSQLPGSVASGQRERCLVSLDFGVCADVQTSESSQPQVTGMLPSFPVLLPGLPRVWEHSGSRTNPAGLAHAIPALTNSGGSSKALLLPADNRGKKIIHPHPQSNLCRWVLKQVSNRLPLETTEQALKNPLYF